MEDLSSIIAYGLKLKQSKKETSRIENENNKVKHLFGTFS